MGGSPLKVGIQKPSASSLSNRDSGRLGEYEDDFGEEEEEEDDEDGGNHGGRGNGGGRQGERGGGGNVRRRNKVGKMDGWMVGRCDLVQGRHMR